jgi:DnaJ-class molecular chaperone
MTLDEARAHLGVSAAATVDEIRDAFRRRARALHPDLHPHSNSDDRARLGHEFNMAREARDILDRRG